MKVVLIGNPNCGKSSLFNHLTGLRQKIGNFPGVTVDKKMGFCKVFDGSTVEIVDLPGTYSLYPNSLDEQVVLETLINPKNPDYPDLAVVVVDSSNLKRNLLLFEQIKSLQIPCVLALNLLDVAQEQGVEIDSIKLEKEVGVPVVELNAREGIGIEGLKLQIFKSLDNKPQYASFVSSDYQLNHTLDEVRKRFGLKTNYAALHFLAQKDKISFLKKTEKTFLDKLSEMIEFDSQAYQSSEIIEKYNQIDLRLAKIQMYAPKEELSFSQRLDKILLHKVWGYLIFLGILFTIFQSVFLFSQWPMDIIDSGIAWLTTQVENVLPASKIRDLLTQGLIAGIGGVVIFIPQIAFLFAFISILEESGYMARVVVLMDRLIRRFGLNGKSVVPLISGMACAVPAIMSARTIGNWKDRLITIFVTPLMSCSARLPIYTILIELVMPDTYVAGIVSWQGLSLMFLYLLGFFAAIFSAWIMKIFLKTGEKSYFVMELPTYKAPRWKQVAFTLLENTKSFVLDAGKVIVAISIVLWVLSSYGPGADFKNIESEVEKTYATLNQEEKEVKVASLKLQNSYAGHFGKFIEPVLKPLGYDWKIGIALISSFAAREVFVGTMSTIYSIGGNDANSETLKSKLKNEKNPETGQPVFTFAIAWSLLIFYVFAMMCMSTLAVVKRETKSWKWPIIQLVYMSALAYVSAYGVYQFLR
ncbi:MAG: ferrous iron transport protein B [Leadbetterella sp.]